MPPSRCCIDGGRPSSFVEITEQRHARALGARGRTEPRATPNCARRGGTRRRQNVVWLPSAKQVAIPVSPKPLLGGRPGIVLDVVDGLPDFNLQLVGCSPDRCRTLLQTTRGGGRGRGVGLWAVEATGPRTGLPASRPHHPAIARGWGPSTRERMVVPGTPPAVCPASAIPSGWREHGRRHPKINPRRKAIPAALVWMSKFWL